MLSGSYPEFSRQTGRFFRQIEGRHITEHDLKAGMVVAHPGRVIGPDQETYPYLKAIVLIFNEQHSEIVSIPAQAPIEFLSPDNPLGQAFPIIFTKVLKRRAAGKDAPYLVKSFRGEGCDPMPLSGRADRALAVFLFSAKIVGKEPRPPCLEILCCPLAQKPVMIGSDPVGIDLQVGMKKRSSRRWKMVLGNSHIHSLGVGGADSAEVLGTVQKTIAVGTRGCRPYLNKMRVVKQADSGKGTVREKIGKEKGFAADEPS